MIRLTRKRSASGVPAGFRGAKRVERLEELVREREAGTLAFRAAVWKPAKAFLKRESGGKCAYCEAPTDAVAHGDVEHFRPKSIYWWLAYCFDNYAFSCQICNQTYKGDQFPVSGVAMEAGDTAVPARLTPDPVNEAEGMAWADFAAGCAREGAHLPDVYRDDPEALFRWEADETRKEVRLAARADVAGSAEALAAAEGVLGLNRAELKGLRWTVYEDLDAFREALGALPAGGAAAGKVRRRLEAMMEDGAEFAGMVRYFVREKWGMGI